MAINSNRLQLIKSLQSIRLLDLVFPNLCVCCGSHLSFSEHIICSICEFQLPKSNYWKQKQTPIEKSFLGRLDIAFGISYLLFNKNGLTQNLLHQLKYKGQKNIGIKMGRDFGEIIKNYERFQSIDLLIPVPLHYKKLSLRGYNQSLLISSGLSEQLGAKLSTTDLVRVGNQKSQTNLNRIERWENVKNSFQLVSHKAVSGKNIAIVDDVFTTGSTIEACIHQVLKGKPKSIGVLTLAHSH